MSRARWPFGGGKPAPHVPMPRRDPAEGLQRVVAALREYIADERQYGVDIALTKLKARRERRKP